MFPNTSEVSKAIFSRLLKASLVNFKLPLLFGCLWRTLAVAKVLCAFSVSSETVSLPDGPGRLRSRIVLGVFKPKFSWYLFLTIIAISWWKTQPKNRSMWVSRKSPNIPEEGNSYPSLRGRRLKGKGKGILGAREMRGPDRARREGGKRSFPPSSRAPRVSLGPKTPFPFPFKRLPRRLQLSRHLLLNEQKKVRKKSLVPLEFSCEYVEVAYFDGYQPTGQLYQLSGHNLLQSVWATTRFNNAPIIQCKYTRK